MNSVFKKFQYVSLGSGILGISLLVFMAWQGTQREEMTEREITPPEAVVSRGESIQREEKESTEEVTLQAPVDRACERVTKKPFGIYIDRVTSPVQPERFSGYHTGADFEIFPEEADTDVVVRALCDGEILVKRFSSGYGGLLVTSCVLEEKEVAVIYGHLALWSIGKNIGDTVREGDTLGLLGRGGSPDTDGERKHLHLGIHRGTSIDVSGYTKERKEGEYWIDPISLICAS